MNDGRRWFHLELPSDREALPWVSHGLRGFLRATGWCRRDAFRIDLAVNEALDNAIRHGNRRDPDLTVQLSVEDDGESIRMEITDRGRGFDPRMVQPLQERNLALAEGGRGLIHMRRLTDEVEVDCGPEGTRVRMRKFHRPDERKLAS